MLLPGQSCVSRWPSSPFLALNNTRIQKPRAITAGVKGRETSVEIDLSHLVLGLDGVRTHASESEARGLFFLEKRN